MNEEELFYDAEEEYCDPGAQKQQSSFECIGRAWVLLSHSHTHTHNLKLLLLAALQAQELATAFTGTNQCGHCICRCMLQNTALSNSAAHALQLLALGTSYDPSWG
jgi:hypothetical protein